MDFPQKWATSKESSLMWEWSLWFHWTATQKNKNKLFTDIGNVMAALSTALTLPSSASVTVFSYSCLPCILLCSCQRALAFSLRTAAKFSGFVCRAPFLPPLQHLIGLILKNVFTPLPLCTHSSDSDHRWPSTADLHQPTPPSCTLRPSGRVRSLPWHCSSLSADDPQPHLQL